MSKANAATGCLHTGMAEPHTCCAAGTDCDGGERRDHTCVGMTEPTSRQPLGCTNAKGECCEQACLHITEPRICCAVGTGSLLREQCFSGGISFNKGVQYGTVLISLARVMLFRVCDALEDSAGYRSLNFSCESSAFQGLLVWIYWLTHWLS